MNTKTRAEYRQKRILQLETELAQLRIEEIASLGIDREAIILKCKELKGNNKPIEATKLYREKTGCGLREAFEAIQALQI